MQPNTPTALRPGKHELGPGSGTLQVLTYREGIGQKVGHDLILDVAGWHATVEVGSDGAPAAIALEVDARSLQVRQGLHGVKPLTDRDRASIRRDIDAKILRGGPIQFRSTEVEPNAGGLSVSGELTLAGATRPASFQLELSDADRLSGRLPVTQTEWGIKPYRGFMGALKVRDIVEVVVDVRLPES